jgi:hypothetical protein
MVFLVVGEGNVVFAHVSLYGHVSRPREPLKRLRFCCSTVRTIHILPNNILYF